MVALKLTRIGNSTGLVLPKEILARLNAKEGDKLHAVETQHGIMITPYDPQFEKTMRNADKVFARFKNAYKELAKK